MPAKKKTTAKTDTAKKTVAKKAPVKKTTKKVSKKPMKTPELVRGMKDILPDQGYRWAQFFDHASKTAQAYGFRYVSTPILEPANLFQRSLGKGTDIIDKEMYVFEDKDGSKLALRPESTASIARSYINHGLHTLPQPVKMWHFGPKFRHERPQAGRYRQFHQFDCDTLGVHAPVVDAELIALAYHIVHDLGVEATVRINSIGSLEDRQNYLVEFVGYLRSKRAYLSEESKKRINKNPLRILDSKDEADQEVIAEAPQIIDWLSKDSKDYFMKVLEFLDELEIPYELDPTLVRGLDYYSDTVFEIYVTGEEGEARLALGGGGRYNGLVEELGGQPTPAAGFGLGIERIMLALDRAQEKGEDIALATKPTYQFYLAQLGEKAQKRALHIVEQLRKADIPVAFHLAKSSLKAQLELANKAGASHAVILGQKEVQDGTVIIRDMDSGIQEIVDQKKVVKHLTKLLAKLQK